MGTYTAFVFFGKEHEFHGGIIPSHMLMLSENDRPAWLLFKLPLHLQEGFKPLTPIIIPTLEHMLEDGLLLLGLLALRDGKLCAEAARVFGEGWERLSHIELYNYNLSDVERLRLLNKEALESSRGKLVIAALAGSSIRVDKKKLQDWRIGVELLKPIDRPRFAKPFRTTNLGSENR